MRRYASTYLQKGERPLRIEIPEQIYQLGGYERSRRLTLSIARLTKKGHIQLDRCERFSLRLAPFPSSDLAHLFFVKVSLKSRPNTLAQVLDFFKVHEIDILECRSVDRGQSSVDRTPPAADREPSGGGLLELIVSVDRGNHRTLLGEGATADHPTILKKKLLAHLGYPEVRTRAGEPLHASGDPASEDPGAGVVSERDVLQDEGADISRSIEIVQPLDDDTVEQLIANHRGRFVHVEVARGDLIAPRPDRPSPTGRLVLERPGAEHGNSPGEETAALQHAETRHYALSLDKLSEDEELYLTFQRECPENNYVSLIFDDRANVLQAVFKDPREIIVNFFASLENRPGQLEKVVGPLGKLAVDLRLINPLPPARIPEQWKSSVGDDHIAYEIIGNVENTKLRLFDKSSMLAILRAEIFNSVKSADKVPILQIADIPMNAAKMNDVAIAVRHCSLMSRRSLGEPRAAPEQSGAVRDEGPSMLLPWAEDSPGSIDLHFLSGRLPGGATALLHVQLKVSEGSSVWSACNRDLLTELLKEVFENQLAELATDPPQENLSELLENAFLAAASDALHGVLLVHDCDRLCEMVESIHTRTYLAPLQSLIENNIARLSERFCNLRYGLLPFLGREQRIYLRQPGGASGFRLCDALDDFRRDALCIQQNLELIVDDLNQAKMPARENLEALASAAAAIRTLVRSENAVTFEEVKAHRETLRKETRPSDP